MKVNEVRTHYLHDKNMNVNDVRSAIDIMLIISLSRVLLALP